LNYKIYARFGILEKELWQGPLASSPRRPIAACPGPRVRGSTVVAWSPPATPPPRAGGPSAAGDTLDTGSHRPHVCHPPPENAPILSSLRPKPFCFPLLATERHCQGHHHSSSPCRAALHNATLATPLLCSGRQRATVLVCLASLPSRYFRPRGESMAEAPPASSLPPPSIAARMSQGTVESGHGTGALRPPRAPSSHHST
jgi:hypothetical protein